MAFRAPIQVGLVLFALGQGVTVHAQLATITLIDPDGNVGSPNAIAYGPNGLALISYYDGMNRDLELARCLDVACTTFTTTTLDAVRRDARKKRSGPKTDFEQASLQ